MTRFFVFGFFVFSGTFLFAGPAAAFNVNLEATPISACAVRLNWDLVRQNDNEVLPNNYSVQVEREPDSWVTVLNNTNAREYIFADNHNVLNLYPGENRNYRIRISGGGQPVDSNITRDIQTFSLVNVGTPDLPGNLRNQWRGEQNNYGLDLFFDPAVNQSDENRWGQQQRSYDIDEFTGFQISRNSRNNPYSLLSFADFAGVFSPADVNEIRLDRNNVFTVKTYQTDQYCDSLINDANHPRILFSQSGREMTIPQASADFIEKTRGDDRGATTISFQWNNNDRGNVSFFRLFQFVGDSIDSIDSEQTRDGSVSESKNFYFSDRQSSYRMTLDACRAGEQSLGCSFPVSLTTRAELPEPQNFRWGLQRLLRNNEANIFLSWKDSNILGNRLGTEIWRRIFGGQWPEEPLRSFVNEFPESFIDYAGLDDAYQYRIDFVYRNGNQQIRSSSPVLTVNLNGLQPVLGWAWSGNLGWVKLENYDVNNLNRNYGVYVNANNQVMGYGWSGNAGWVSFNAGDLAGCPDNPDGNCVAPRQENGQIVGWAKFLAADQSRGLWSGWLHLGNLIDNPIDDLEDGGEERRGGAAADPNSFFSSVLQALSRLLKI